MQIEISEPDGKQPLVIDSGVQRVTIKNTFLGVLFVTEAREKLSVCMRDDGFEVHYYRDGEKSFDTGWTEFKDGTIMHGPKRLVNL